MIKYLLTKNNNCIKELYSIIDMEYNPNKKHIKCCLPTEDSIINIPENVLCPFFIEYSSMHPFILFTFRINENKELDFIDNCYYIYPEVILENEFNQLYTKACFNHHLSIFYEIKDKENQYLPLDFSGTYYNIYTRIWFVSTYELYHSKKMFDISFSERVSQFFLDNPHLEFISWNDEIQPTPIIAYSSDNLKNTIFQSTFGSTFSPTTPHYTLYKTPEDWTSPVVRYALFHTPKNETIYTFNEHNLHIPLCYSSFFISTINLP